MTTDLSDYALLNRFPARLRPKVQAILDRARGTTGKGGISSAPKDYRQYETGYLIAQLIQADPELHDAFTQTQADPPPPEGRAVDPAPERAGGDERTPDLFDWAGGD